MKACTCTLNKMLNVKMADDGDFYFSIGGIRIAPGQAASLCNSSHLDRFVKARTKHTL